MGTGLSDVDMQMIALWEEMKPREATNLRFIAMDADGNFAGQFSVEIDPHGDRYFTLTETSGMQAIKSNLVSNLDKDEADLPKTAIKTREQYKAIISQAIYKLDLTGIPADTSLSTLQGATEISGLFR